MSSYARTGRCMVFFHPYTRSETEQCGASHGPPIVFLARAALKKFCGARQPIFLWYRHVWLVILAAYSLRDPCKNWFISPLPISVLRPGGRFFLQAVDRLRHSPEGIKPKSTVNSVRLFYLRGPGITPVYSVKNFSRDLLLPCTRRVKNWHPTRFKLYAICPPNNRCLLSFSGLMAPTSIQNDHRLGRFRFFPQHKNVM